VRLAISLVEKKCIDEELGFDNTRKDHIRNFDKTTQ
jgi:hypothetical protein